MTNRLLLAAFGLFIAVVAESTAAQVTAAPVATAPAAAKRQKVIVVGASVSAGFEDLTSRMPDGTANRSYKLDVVLKKVWSRKTARIYNVANMLMFSNALGTGRKQVDMAVKLKPALVLGIDFPFWFGYGMVSKAKAGAVNQRRLARQQQLFKLLDKLPGPILLGDYPDMHGASTKMLPRYMIPNVATIAALNQALHGYAARRANVEIVSLARFVKRAVTVPQTYAYGTGKVVFPKNYLLQSDRLHATRLGTVVLTSHLLSALPKILPPGSQLLGHQASLHSLVAALGLQDALPQPKK